MHERWIHLGHPESALACSQWLRGERRICTGVVPAKVGLLIKWGSCHTLKGNFDSRSKSHFLVKGLTSWQMFWAPISCELSIWRKVKFYERWPSDPLLRIYGGHLLCYSLEIYGGILRIYGGHLLCHSLNVAGADERGRILVSLSCIDRPHSGLWAW